MNILTLLILKKQTLLDLRKKMELIEAFFIFMLKMGILLFLLAKYNLLVKNIYIKVNYGLKALKMNRTSTKILTVFRSTVEL